ncbi:DNA-binding transcription factor [Neocucurbitaria cava]|uniref:DNA-binding transcription factor n=1 Tax=Neocucurbitaria cava TaxID=798079 RepID=A0A9W8Y6C7_9PLEO|nr:DNA-binding transcription factor [Neocucurbitaria cava]
MAAVVAAHHVGLWQQRREPSTHYSNMQLTGLMPSYETSRSVTTTPVSRSFTPTTTHMDISMPLFSTNGLPTSVPYQSGAFAFDSIPVNPYNMQQTSYYPSNASQTVSYAPVSEIRPLPTVRDTRSAFITDRTPVVKSESTSPIQSNSMFNDPAYAVECKRSSSEPLEGSGINFATDVDTLMKAIQAKQTTTVPQQETRVGTYNPLFW